MPVDIQPSPAPAPSYPPAETAAQRWGAAADAGFTLLPNTLLRAQGKLGLSANDVVVLANILMHWWHRDQLPYPRAQAIANRSGLGLRTVQRSIRELVGKGLLTRVPGAARTRYSLEGLRSALEKLAPGDAWYRPQKGPNGPAAKEMAG
jgi:hypothetical protein